MKEIKCPKCGSVFTVDEADYASIVSQVKNAEFKDEVERRINELHKQHQAEMVADNLKIEQGYQEKINAKQLELSRKEAEIARLKADLEQNSSKLQIAVLAEQNRAKEELQEKEKKIFELQSKVTAEKEAASVGQKTAVHEDTEV